MWSSGACLQLLCEGGQTVPRGSLLVILLKAFVVCFLDQVDGSFGICVVKDDTKISIEP